MKNGERIKTCLVRSNSWSIMMYDLLRANINSFLDTFYLMKFQRDNLEEETYKFESSKCENSYIQEGLKDLVPDHYKRPNRSVIVNCLFCFVCLLCYVPLKNFSFIRRRHHRQWRASKPRPTLGAQGPRAGRDPHSAIPAVARDSGHSGLIRRTAQLSRPHNTHGDAKDPP
jgi:hypothetical protein